VADARAPVVDIHIHPPIGTLIPESFAAFIGGDHPGGFAGLMERYGTREQLLAHLDANGVDYGVLLAQTVPLTSEYLEPERLADFCAGHPRLIPCATVNPYLVLDPARELERLVTQRGFRALKLYPTYAYFYPNDRVLYPVYAVAERLRIPVLVHTGSSTFRGARLKYGDPLFLDDVAVDFPELSILLSHGGRPLWYDHAETLIRFHEHVYVDVAGLPPRKLPEYFPNLRRLAHKFVFGSDWPGPAVDIAANIQAIRELDLGAAVTADILGGTAARLLRLEPLA
jgi:predicted TIM-barrel fold metal-dependent hydrolase